MVRGGRIYTRGGRGGTSYRGSSNTNYRGTSGHSTYNNYHGSGGGAHHAGGGNHTGGGSRYGVSGGSYEHTYDSRGSSSRYQGSSNRYQSSRPDEHHKRPYHQSSRDRSPDRKRTRIESSRRSSLEYGNTSGGNYGGGHNNRYEGGGGTYNNTSVRRHEARGSSQMMTRHTTYRPRDDSAHSSRERNMGPPKGVAPRRFRGGATGGPVPYRGRGASNLNRGTGIRRTTIPTATTARVINPNAVLKASATIARNSDLSIRRKLVELKARRDNARKLKIAKLRSSLKKNNLTADKKGVDSDTDALKAEKNGGGTDTNGGSAATEAVDDAVEEDGNDDGADESGSIETTQKKAMAKVKPKAKVEPNESGDDNDDVEMDADDDEEALLDQVDEQIDDEDETAIEEDVEEDFDGGDLAVSDDLSEQELEDEIEELSKQRRFSKGPYIKLSCVHCRISCHTFKAYAHHLYSRTHKASLRRVALRQKAQLARMRLAQRNQQRQLEESADYSEEMNSQFCLLCRLNYRSEKADHQASESHRRMKKFLMPYCLVCRVGFKSPMEFETHRCSLDHIKRKARQEVVRPETEDEECEIDLEQFMTVDSIGDVDDLNGDADDDAAVNEIQKDAGDAVTTPVVKISKPEINVGNEHMKKVEVYYCDLCRFYLPYNEEQEAALKKHCGTHSHLRSYLRYKENQNLRLAAEKIHRRHQEQREAKRERVAAGDEETKKLVTAPVKADAAKATTATTTSVASAAAGVAAATSVDDDAVDEKIWADVDKDLGELLQAVSTDTVNDDEDEDSTTTTERYDRFKNSGKKDAVDGKKTNDAGKADGVPEKSDKAEAATEKTKEAQTKDAVAPANNSNAAASTTNASATAK